MMPSWEAVHAADAADTEARRALETAQAQTQTAQDALSGAQETYDAAKAAEAEAEAHAEQAQAHLVEVSKEVGIDYPPEGSPAAARRR